LPRFLIFRAVGGMRRVQISCDICTRFARYLYSTKQCLDNKFCYSIELLNASRSLGEREMLWEHEPTGKNSTTFLSSSKLSRMYGKIFCYFRKGRDERKRTIVYFDHQKQLYTLSGYTLSAIFDPGFSICPLVHRNIFTD